MKRQCKIGGFVSASEHRALASSRIERDVNYCVEQNQKTATDMMWCADAVVGVGMMVLFLVQHQSSTFAIHIATNIQLEVQSEVQRREWGEGMGARGVLSTCTRTRSIYISGSLCRITDFLGLSHKVHEGEEEKAVALE